MIRAYWMLCHDCGYEWVVNVTVDFDRSIYLEKEEDAKCPECGYEDSEVTNEFRGPTQREEEHFKKAWRSSG
jgi:hypothetical protein